MSSPKKRLPVVMARPAALEPEVLAGVVDGEASVARAAFAHGPPGVAEAATLARERADRLAAAVLASHPPPTPIHCGAGCAHCCHAKVLVVAPEAVRLAEHLRSTLPEAAFELLLERVRETDEVTRGLTRAERTARRVPCPLLDDTGRCSAYEARPIVCASWTSLDVTACVTSYEDKTAPSAPVYAPGYEIANAVLAGLGKGCFDEGLDGTPLELVAALRIALERPNAAERYLAKRPVFVAARDAEWLRANAK